MADFSVRADHIDVEQIMRQIRARIRDKRGADYTEDEIRELAAVKLEKFLDPRAVRSDLLQHYRRQNQPTPLIMPEEAHPPLWNFTPDTVYVSDRGVAGRILTIIRKILKPFSKLFFHVDTVWDVLSKQSVINAQHTRLFQRAHQRFITRDELDALNFEMFNNLVVELTRLGIEVKNLRMQVESFGTRLDFDERRARALEGVVQYRPGATVAKPPPPSAAGGDEDEEEPIGPGGAGASAGESGDSLSRSARRRRRRRGRRRGPGEGGPMEGDEGSERDDQSPREARDPRPQYDAGRPADPGNGGTDRASDVPSPRPDRPRDPQGWGTRRDASQEGAAATAASADETASAGADRPRDPQVWGARRDESPEGSAATKAGADETASAGADRPRDPQVWGARRDESAEGSAAPPAPAEQSLDTPDWGTRRDESAEGSAFVEPEPPAQPDAEPASQPFFAEPEPVSEEPQRVFHRVFDRPRDPAPEPSASEPSTQDAPRRDDHEPTQS